MNFHFSEEDAATAERAVDMRRALLYGRHLVTRGDAAAGAPAGTDIWMHGLASHTAEPMRPEIVAALLRTPGAVVLFQLCDATTLQFDRVPEALRSRARLFLRNHWPADPAVIPADVRDRIGWMPPMLRTMPPRAGRPLRERSIRTMFHGRRTGGDNLGGGRNAREETVRRMQASGLPFEGGLVAHDEPGYRNTLVESVPEVSRRVHAQRLRDTFICIAPWGNHVLTYRLFEGLACRCLVLAQSIASAAIVDSGLVADRHYVEIAADLGDLVDKAGYYLAHPDDAQRIADAGHAHFNERLAPRGRLVSDWIYQACVRSWGPLYHDGDAQGVAALWRAWRARLLRRGF